MLHNRFIRAQEGMSSVEFALVAIVFLMFILGTFDFSRALWEWNSASQATQAGVRFAVVNDIVSDELNDFVGTDVIGVGAGDSVPVGSVTSPITCPQTPGGTSCSTGTMNTDAFDAIVARMQAYYDKIGPDNVVVEYRYDSELGFAGNPLGPDVDPMVTVRLIDMEFNLVTPALFQLDPIISMPDFAASLSGEDHQS